jgi:hypothetical protein
LARLAGVALDEIIRRRGVHVAARETASFPAMHTLDPRSPHQTSDAFTAAPDVVIEPQLDVHAWRAIGATRPFPDVTDRGTDLGVAHRPG